MTVIYENRGFTKRQTLSAAVLVLVTFYGLWELWAAYSGERSDGFMFGVLFLGGAAYGYVQITNDSRDRVARLETGPNGESIVTMWRPTGTVKLTSDEALTDWRYYVKVISKRSKKPLLRARHRGHAHALEFELRPDIQLSQALRALAPEAIAEYEAATAPPAKT
jgi:hypothetical protein